MVRALVPFRALAARSAHSPRSRRRVSSFWAELTFLWSRSRISVIRRPKLRHPFQSSRIIEHKQRRFDAAIVAIAQWIRVPRCLHTSEAVVIVGPNCHCWSVVLLPLCLSCANTRSASQRTLAIFCTFCTSIQTARYRTMSR